MPLSPSFVNHSDSRAPGAGVTAVLGPTNTGKTHLAIERMVAHSSGIIGLPLRLLAREVYNKIADRVGPAAVALITGEEKIKPLHARYWVSTVEAMPRDIDVSFLAVDEIQIASDLERGHVFTDRILNRRGRDETLLLGAATMRPIIERLLPGVSVVTRPRMSQLSFVGDRKITRQPRRTAIVAFSADEVYAIAELIRRQHGGAAVVLGSLSPRTRNSQVEMFQNGDVDYLVATDAIGMGLNLDVDHVAFASDRKYDGYQYRRLTPSEFAQIAGRAGRATRDGTFGTTGRCAPFDNELVNALQNHAFDTVKTLQWRNSRLDFASLGALQMSLSLTPQHDALTRAPMAEDVRVLDHAARDPEVRDMAVTPLAVERLWDACLVPDYRRLAPAAHAELVTTLYGFLMRQGRIPDDWFAAQVAQSDRTDGDIDTLSARIAQIRTWTFAANRPDWLGDPEHWQGIAREVENKLSDALHERLTERFVDRRTSVLMRRLRENTMLNTEIGKTGEVVVEGHAIGRLDGFMFTPAAAEAGSDAKALQAAAQQALAGEISTRAERLSGAADDQFVLASDGVVRWIGDAVARLASSETMLQPRLRILSDEHLTGAPRDSVQARLDLWLKTHVEKLLGPLFDIQKAEDITGIARGIAFQVVEALGVLERQKIAAEMKDLDQPSRATLRKYGVRFGAYHIYLPNLLKPAARNLASLLWAQKQDDVDFSALLGAQQLASSGRTSFPIDKQLDRDAYRVLGYRPCGERAVRVDILERLADLIRPALGWREGASGAKPSGAFDGRGFTVTQAMTSLTGSAGEDFASILKALGYRMDRRPPLPAPVAAPPAADASAADALSAVAAPAHVPAAIDPETYALDGHESEVMLSDIIAPIAEAAAAVEIQPVETVAITDVASVAAEEPAPDTAPVAAETSEVSSATVAATGDAVSAEPQMVEVWRPGGRSDERRPRPERHRSRHQRAPEGQAAPLNADATAGPSSREHRDGPKDGARRDRDRDFRKRREEQNKPAAAGGPDANSSERPSRQPFRGKPSAGQGRPFGKPHGKRPDARPGTWSSEAPAAKRDRPIDPNSPFAKLAALKEQLAKDR